MPAYASLAVQTREYVVIVMWAGQFACEALSWLIKRAVKENRPAGSVGVCCENRFHAHVHIFQRIGNGYGFPSSHSQYMGYFATFLICHLYFQHKFGTTGYTLLDFTWRVLVYFAICSWALLVAYSRYALGYHNAHQILWGFGIGVFFAIMLFVASQILPRRQPSSIFGKLKIFLLANPVSTWFQIRDGWDVWADGGREHEWLRWRKEWDSKRRRHDKKQS
ncbi:PAP2-domain-containing protein [Guyanagaster necrorhizus]|uniref:PAP2-domain-containing protein n=1 Tax=Guyanagaster necrorhizus TaxID=856835 RepID=A0A9P7VS55_9AGAR|nr:PAP2-domain-containing protein [Guyanagaster necrorhizus MCA 3950]KAG7444974.1 PAP2-domain-containing protein [Guyanagaster necrorhizus MCA 3950]